MIRKACSIHALIDRVIYTRMRTPAVICGSGRSCRLLLPTPRCNVEGEPGQMPICRTGFRSKQELHSFGG